MYSTAKKEEFSVAFVKALAAPLGFNPSNYAVDDDSVDIFFKATGYKNAKVRNPQIHLQLKCTQQEFSRDGHLHYTLPTKNHNDLSGDDVVAPTYLVVVTVPQQEGDWVQCDPDKMILLYSAYWFSLRKRQPVSGQNTVTVIIPKANKFDLASFKMLMDNASQRIAL